MLANYRKFAKAYAPVLARFANKALSIPGMELVVNGNKVQPMLKAIWSFPSVTDDSPFDRNSIIEQGVDIDALAASLEEDYWLHQSFRSSDTQNRELAELLSKTSNENGKALVTILSEEVMAYIEPQDYVPRIEIKHNMIPYVMNQVQVILANFRELKEEDKDTICRANDIYIAMWEMNGNIEDNKKLGSKAFYKAFEKTYGTSIDFKDDFYADRDPFYHWHNEVASFTLPYVLKEHYNLKTGYPKK